MSNYYIRNADETIGTAKISDHVLQSEIVREDTDGYPILLLELDKDFYKNKFDGEYIGIKLVLAGRPGEQWKLAGLFEGTDELAFISHQFDGAEYLLDWLAETCIMAFIVDFQNITVQNGEEFDHYESQEFDKEECRSTCSEYLDMIREPVDVNGG